MINSRKFAGFTIIEVVAFIIVTSLVMTTILLSATLTLRNAPKVHQQWVALETAKRCMEWFVQQRRLNGFASLACPSTPTATACSAPSGYTITNTIACTTWNSDTEFKTLTVAITGNASVSLSTQLGNY
jgi:type II secretory pathway pseudopilin PulG